jgi:predicted Zn finger-like uncharacterized protein
MRSPLPSSVVIACPHCGTRYQVAADALGLGGRQVQCATCGKSWQAQAPGIAGAPPSAPQSDTLFDAEAERELDAAFEEAERALAAEGEPSASMDEAAAMADAQLDIEADAAAGGVGQPAAAPRDPALRKRQQRAFSRRQALFSKRMPVARVRRVLRTIGITTLLGLIVGGIAFRVEIVRALPGLAAVYEAVGLGVNVVGLEFRDLSTLVTLRDGAPVMKVDARIYSVAARPVVVPPVIVSVLDAAGNSLYEWRVPPDAPDLEPGEVVDFTAQLNAPPAGAERVKLSFASSRARSDTASPSDTSR